MFGRFLESVENQRQKYAIGNLTYGDLKVEVEKLTRRLERLGCDHRSLVLTWTDDPCQLTITLLSALASGITLLPLHTGLPTVQLRHVVEIFQPDLVLPKPGQDLDPCFGDTPTLEIGQQPSKPPSSPINRCLYGDLIHLTSGTSGVPKAVAATWEGVAHFVDLAIPFFGLVPGRKVSQLAAPGFDAFLKDVLPALCCGAQICLPPSPLTVADPLALAYWLANEAIEVLMCVPSVLRTLIALRDPEPLPHLKTLVLAGEAIDGHDLDRFKHLFQTSPEVLNLYGPTETVITKTWFRVPEQVSQGVLPIGSAMEGTDCELFDPSLQVAREGEICISTPFDLPGYPCHPAHTAELFVPDPRNLKAGGILYKTGDKGIRDQSGLLHWRGRLGRQLKLRGVRTEAEGLESVLRGHPQVEDAIVMGKKDGLGNEIAVAFVVSAAEIPDLIDFVSTQLPAAQRPSQYHWMRVLPKLANGKTDLGALWRLLQNGQTNVGEGKLAHITRIWGELLGVAVGPDDNFFRLGGHSLLVALTLNRTAAVCDCDLQVVDLFQNPTPRLLLQHLEKRSALDIPSKDLSLEQQRILYRCMREETGTAYHMFTGFSLRGPLDISRLEAAIEEVIQSQSLCQQVIEASGGYQLVARATQAFSLLVIETLEVGLIAELFEDPFEIFEDLSPRALLFRRGQDLHDLVLLAHHLVWDETSTTLFFNALKESYAGTYQDPQIGKVGFSELLPHEAGPAEDLQLPYDGFPEACPSEHSLQMKMDAGIQASIFKLAKDVGATPSQVLLVLYATLIGRFTAAETVRIGLPVDGRGSRHEQRIGMFVRTIDFLMTIHPERDLPTSLRAATKQFNQGLTSESRPTRPQLFFNLIPKQPIIDIDGLEVSRLRQPRRHAKFELSLLFEVVDDGLVGRLSYRGDLFAKSTITNMVACFEYLMNEWLSKPELSIRSLTMMPRQQLKALLQSWNQVPEASSLAILPRLKELARRKGNQMALLGPDHTLNYHELWLRVVGLSSSLEAQGIGPCKRVAGWCCRRQESLIYAIATFYVGAIWVPLDPGLSPQRVEQILQDVEPDLLLVPAGVTVPYLSEWQLVWQHRESERIPQPYQGNHPSHIYYTSGSSQAKGVLGHRFALEQFLAWQIESFSLDPSVRAAQLVRPAFDAWLRDVLVPLCAGGSLYLPSADESEPATPDLVTWLEAERINLIHRVPSLFRPLLNHLPRLQNLRWVFLSGEAVRTEDVLRFYEGMPEGASLVNFYGSTETLMIKYFQVTSASEALGVSIGRPMAGCWGLVLDNQEQPCPRGAVGELYLKTPYGSLGYWRNPRMTAKVFIPDPLGGDGLPVYRTGDLVRQRLDGSLVWLGRADDQVKLNGQRVSLNEIEQVLRRHPMVDEAVVTYDGQLLVAHLVGSFTKTSLLRAFANEHLPPAWVPASFRQLSHLPRLVSGKPDRKRLQNAVVDKSSHPPRSGIEARIAHVWREYLTVQEVLREDNFFALGGHSLLATQVCRQIAAMFGVEIQAASLFMYPRLRDFARFIQQAPTRSLKQLPIEGGLNPAQRRILSWQRLFPERGTYNMPRLWQLQEAIDVLALEGALLQLFEHHAQLRWCLPQDDEPVATTIPIQLEVIDGRKLAVGELAMAPFRPGELLWRVMLLRGSADDQLLLIIHHTICDGESLEQLSQQMVRCYRAKVKGLQAELPEVPEPLVPAHPKHLRNQWREFLGNAPSQTRLESKTREKTDTRSHRIPLHLDASARKRLDQLAARLSLTRPVILLAGFALLVHRYLDRDDLVLGLPVSWREHPAAIGLFVHLLPIRFRVEASMSLVQWLVTIQENYQLIQASRQLSFEEVTEALELDFSAEDHPLFQVIFDYQFVPRAEECFEGDTIWLNQEAKFAVTVQWQDRDDNLSGYMETKPEYWDYPSSARLTVHYQNLIHGLLNEPEIPLGQQQMLTEDELDQILIQWNQCHSMSPERTHFLEQFRSFAVANPTRSAIQTPTASVDYEGLLQRVAGIAHLLRQSGVKLGDPIGVRLARDIDLPATILAIFSLGAVYVPIEPRLPRHRQNWILADSDAVLLITDICEPDDKIPVLTLTNFPEASWIPALEPFGIAYILYTSGSTGEPKGVLLTVDNIQSMVAWANQVLGSHRLEKVLAGTAVSFDLSIFELIVPLVLGGSIVVMSDLLECQIDDDVRLINTVPSAASALLDSGRFPGSAEICCLAGEPLQRDLVERLYATGHVTDVYNFYGPTEATTYATFKRIARSSVDSPAIGNSLPNARTYVLDNRLRAVPIGQVGVLYLSGLGLSVGYHHRPGLTAGSFIPDPFVRNSRLYNTGDLAYYDHEGDLHFVGRRDRQIKLRGYRIEPEEIERILQAHSGADRCAVKVFNREKTTLLAAFVEPEIFIARLQQAAQKFLPDYMRPAIFETRAFLPRTVNGKVDYAALSLNLARSESSMTNGEQRLAQIWSEVLGLEQVHACDNFFALGGDSLQALRLAARARELDFTFAAVDVLRHANIRNLLRHIDDAPRPQPVKPLRGRLPLSSIQAWFFALELAQPFHFNQASLVSLPDTLETHQVQVILDTLMNHHDMLRASFHHDTNGVPYQEIAADWGGVIVTSLDLRDGDQSIEDIAAQLQASLRLEGPLLGAIHLRNPAALLIVAHHLIVDEVSWLILEQDIQRLTEQLVHGNELNLPPNTNSYADFIKSVDPIYPVPKSDFTNDIYLFETMREIVWSRTETANIIRWVKELELSLETVLLAALARASCSNRFSIQVERHGRQPSLDFSRTLGWFTQLVDLELEVDPRNDLAATAFEIDHLLSHGDPAEEVPKDVFNFIGKRSSRHPQKLGPNRGPLNRRPHRWELIAAVASETLVMRVFYSQRYQERETLNTLESGLRDQLTNLHIRHFPLSPMQQGIVADSEVATSYLVQREIRLSGPLNEELLFRAWQHVMNANPALRSSLNPSHQSQQIHDNLAMSWRFEDWQHLDQVDQPGLQSFMKKDRQLGFDLTKPPLMRFSLIRLQADGYWALWTFHHFLLDGWSSALVWQQVVTAYQRLLAGKQNQVAHRPSWLAWLHRLKHRDLTATRTFWQEQPEWHSILDLLHQAKDKETHHQMEMMVIEETISQSLRQLAISCQATLGSVLQLAWEILLGRYSYHSEAVYGLIDSGRLGEQNTDQMVGVLANVLPIRTRLVWSTSFRQNLKDLAERMKDLNDLVPVSLSQINAWLGIISGAAPFQAMFTFQGYPTAKDTTSLPWCQESSRFHEQSSFPLSMSVIDEPVLTCKLKYHGNRLETSRAKRLVVHYLRLLQEIVDHSSLRLDLLKLFSEEEDCQRLAAINQQDFAPTFSIRERFQQISQQYPRETMLLEATRDRSLSFERVDQRSNQVANMLIQHGAGPEKTIALLGDRSLEFVIAFLGILKAGAVYLPITDDQPKLRKERILADAGVHLILSLADGSSRNYGYHQVFLNQSSVYPTTPPQQTFLPESLFALMYTSGSTGIPKAVMLHQRGICSQLVGFIEFLDFTHRDRCILSNSPQFDVSLWELLLPMLTGASLVVPSAGTPDPSDLAYWVRSFAISYLYTVPVMLGELLEQEDFHNTSSLRHLLCGGDLVAPELRQKVGKLMPVGLTVSYGPTESCISCTKLRQAHDPNGEYRSIGYATPNTYMYVFNEHLQSMPFGVRGMLYLGGVEIARGYGCRPGLTAERFVPDPFSKEPGSRLYYSGDQVRLKANGEILFVGRLDHQIKLRGVRIEYGEIEAQILEHPQVKQVAVHLWNGSDLVAYVVGSLTQSELRMFLMQRLPAVMIPNHLEVLGALPLSPNGKLDRKRLPTPTVKPAPQRDLTTTEATLLPLWCEVLQLEESNPFDDFFRLGGNSIRAIQLANRIRERFDLSLQLRDIFLNASLEDLAQWIEEKCSVSTISVAREVLEI